MDFECENVDFKCEDDFVCQALSTCFLKSQEFVEMSSSRVKICENEVNFTYAVMSSSHVMLFYFHILNVLFHIA